MKKDNSKHRSSAAAQSISQSQGQNENNPLTNHYFKNLQFNNKYKSNKLISVKPENDNKLQLQSISQKILSARKAQLLPSPSIQSQQKLNTQATPNKIDPIQMGLTNFSSSCNNHSSLLTQNASLSKERLHNHRTSLPQEQYYFSRKGSSLLSGNKFSNVSPSQQSQTTSMNTKHVKSFLSGQINSSVGNISTMKHNFSGSQNSVKVGSVVLTNNNNVNNFNINNGTNNANTFLHNQFQKSTRINSCMDSNQLQMLSDRSDRQNLSQSNILQSKDQNNTNGTQTTNPTITSEYICMNHPQKKAKYYITKEAPLSSDIKQDSQILDNCLYQYYCSKCAISLASLGQQIKEIGKSDIQIKQQEIEKFLDCLAQRGPRWEEMHNNIVYKKEEISRHYGKQIAKLENMYQLIEKLISQEKNKVLQMLNGEKNLAMNFYDSKEKEMQANLEDFLSIKGDIEGNQDNIVQNIELAPFNVIIGNYKSRIVELDTFFDNLSKESIKVLKIDNKELNSQIMNLFVIEELNTNLLKKSIKLSTEKTPEKSNDIIQQQQQQLSNSAFYDFQQQQHSQQDLKQFDDTTHHSQILSKSQNLPIAPVNYFSNQDGSIKPQQQQLQYQLSNSNSVGNIMTNKATKGNNVLVSFENKDIFQNAINNVSTIEKDFVLSQDQSQKNSNQHLPNDNDINEQIITLGQQIVKPLQQQLSHQKIQQFNMQSVQNQQQSVNQGQHIVIIDHNNSNSISAQKEQKPFKLLFEKDDLHQLNQLVQPSIIIEQPYEQVEQETPQLKTQDYSYTSNDKPHPMNMSKEQNNMTSSKLLFVQNDQNFSNVEINTNSNCNIFNAQTIANNSQQNGYSNANFNNNKYNNILEKISSNQTKNTNFYQEIMKPQQQSQIQPQQIQFPIIQQQQTNVVSPKHLQLNMGDNKENNKKIININNNQLELQNQQQQQNLCQSQNEFSKGQQKRKLSRYEGINQDDLEQQQISIETDSHLQQQQQQIQQNQVEYITSIVPKSMSNMEMKNYENFINYIETKINDDPNPIANNNYQKTLFCSPSFKENNENPCDIDDI